jgi:hypothetical protein
MPSHEPPDTATGVAELAAGAEGDAVDVESLESLDPEAPTPELLSVESSVAVAVCVDDWAAAVLEVATATAASLVEVPWPVETAARPANSAVAPMATDPVAMVSLRTCRSVCSRLSEGCSCSRLLMRTVEQPFLNAS